MDVNPGTSIKQACKDAVLLATYNYENVYFTFNGTKLIATKDSAVEQIMNNISVKEVDKYYSLCNFVHSVKSFQHKYIIGKYNNLL